MSQQLVKVATALSNFESLNREERRDTLQMLGCLEPMVLAKIGAVSQLVRCLGDEDTQVCRVAQEALCRAPTALAENWGTVTQHVADEALQRLDSTWLAAHEVTEGGSLDPVALAAHEEAVVRRAYDAIDDLKRTSLQNDALRRLGCLEPATLSKTCDTDAAAS